MTNWIISHNPSTYKTVKAFIELGGVIDQATKNTIHCGDTVFIYLSSPMHKIVLKTIAIGENISPTALINDSPYFCSEKEYNEFAQNNIDSRFIRLKAVEYFDEDVSCKLTLEDLRKNGYENGNMQSPLILDNNPQLFDYIKSVTI